MMKETKEAHGQEKARLREELRVSFFLCCCWGLGTLRLLFFCLILSFIHFCELALRDVVLTPVNRASREETEN